MIEEAVVSADEKMTRSSVALLEEAMVEILNAIKFVMIIAASKI